MPPLTERLDRNLHEPLEFPDCIFSWERKVNKDCHVNMGYNSFFFSDYNKTLTKKKQFVGREGFIWLMDYRPSLKEPETEAEATEHFSLVCSFWLAQLPSLDSPGPPA